MHIPLLEFVSHPDIVTAPTKPLSLFPPSNSEVRLRQLRTQLPTTCSYAVSGLVCFHPLFLQRPKSTCLFLSPESYEIPPSLVIQTPARLLCLSPRLDSDLRGTLELLLIRLIPCSYSLPFSVCVKITLHISAHSFSIVCVTLHQLTALLWT